MYPGLISQERPPSHRLRRLGMGSRILREGFPFAKAFSYKALEKNHGGRWLHKNRSTRIGKEILRLAESINSALNRVADAAQTLGCRPSQERAGQCLGSSVSLETHICLLEYIRAVELRRRIIARPEYYWTSRRRPCENRKLRPPERPLHRPWALLSVKFFTNRQVTH